MRACKLACRQIGLRRAKNAADVPLLSITTTRITQARAYLPFDTRSETKRV